MDWILLKLQLRSSLTFLSIFGADIKAHPKFALQESLPACRAYAEFMHANVAGRSWSQM
jgi:hypothetical protein